MVDGMKSMAATGDAREAPFTNILNHTSFAPPSIDVSNTSTFGVLQSAQTPETTRAIEPDNSLCGSIYEGEGCSVMHWHQLAGVAAITPRSVDDSKTLRLEVLYERLIPLLDWLSSN